MPMNSKQSASINGLLEPVLSVDQWDDIFAVVGWLFVSLAIISSAYFPDTYFAYSITNFYIRTFTPTVSQLQPI